MKFDKEFWRNLILYGVIGGISALLDILIFMELYGGFKTNEFVANIISTHCGIALSFILNSKYNFKKTNRIMFRAISFYLTGLLGLLLSSGLLAVGALFGMPPNIVKVIAVFVVAAVQFTINRLVAFRR